MTTLSVNLNKVALLRNARNIGIPSVIKAAKTVMRAGAHGVTVHPRPDERHIKYPDVYELAEIVAAACRLPARVGTGRIEFNIEGNPFLGRYMEIVSEIKPDQATLVPDAPDANTSDHGWNLHSKENTGRLGPIIKKLKGLGIRVSIFMDPDIPGIEIAKQIGTDRIELYTEPYARAFESGSYKRSLQQYAEAARAACDIGLGVNAGHDLNLLNLEIFCRAVPGVLEVSIGHALISDALEMGLSAAVKEYLKILSRI
jgi:pyridoxine 5-phosphate synthase